MPQRQQSQRRIDLATKISANGPGKKNQHGEIAFDFTSVSPATAEFLEDAEPSRMHTESGKDLGINLWPAAAAGASSPV